jgi:prephenate dehydrogenase
MKVAVIGLGLIGGSVALLLKQKGMASNVIGVDNNLRHQQKALELGLVHEVLPLKEAIAASDFIVVAVPVDNAIQVLLPVLDLVTNQVVMDMGSTKTQIIEAVKDHPKRGRFVAAHPMWGTEFSGPEAATMYAFAGKAAIICNQHETDDDALLAGQQLLENLGMHLVYMNASDHDVHTAYISHISHITSFALANTVLQKEKEEAAIFELASAGFESTVRLAKSNPDMWVPIFRQNKENVLDVLNEHISQLRKFKACLEKENWEYLRELIQEANNINRILK